MTPREFEPFTEAYEGEVNRMFLHFGVVAATIANVNRDPKQKPEPYQPLDFCPEKMSPRRYLTVEEADRAMDRFIAAHGGVDMRQEG